MPRYTLLNDFLFDDFSVMLFFCCLPKGRLCDPPNEKGLIYAQKCSRGGLGWVMHAWVGLVKVGWVIQGVGWAKVRWMGCVMQGWGGVVHSVVGYVRMGWGGVMQGWGGSKCQVWCSHAGVGGSYRVQGSGQGSHSTRKTLKMTGAFPVMEISRNCIILKDIMEK